MFDVLHPTLNEILSVEEYRDFAIANNYSQTNDAPAGRCPVCDKSMRLRAGQTKDDQHFYHITDKFCSTKSPAGRPYLNRPPYHLDEVAIAVNRAWVAAHIEHIYSRLHAIIPCLDFKEFIKMLKEGARLNIYGYANFQPEHAPYVLVTLMNFLPSTSYNKTRQFKFIFFYDEAIQSHDDLWINRGFGSRLVRVSYKQASTNRVKPIEIDVSYAGQKPTKPLSEAQLRWCRGVM